MTTRFGRYDLLGPIGRGGMAEVFLARYVGPEGFEKQLVIKRVLPRLGNDPRLLRLFFEEAKTQVSLSHGNLVSVFDFGRVGNDYFIAMEHVRGVDLASLLAAERTAGACLPPAIVAHVGIELCRGLAYVHGRGLVHRDVSPRNVLLSADGEVKLSDFGLALAVESPVVPGLRGTPAYMSPEQARGERIDARGDLYSLGLVLAEALVGRRLRDSADDGQALALARAGTPVSADGPLGPILVRATQISPGDRFGSAAEMLAALEQQLATMGAARESLVRELAAKTRPLARPERGGETTPPGPTTSPTLSADGRLLESYFRDDRSDDFVDEVLGPAPAVSADRALRLGLPLGILTLVVVGVLVFKAGGGVERRPAPATLGPFVRPAARPEAAGPPPPPPASPAGAPTASAKPASTRRAQAQATEPTKALGSLLIRCTPWCVPFLDGRPQGSDGRSFLLRDVPEGRHHIEGRRLDDRETRDVEVGAGQQRTVDFTFD